VEELMQHPETPGQVVARRVREVRERRGWSRDRLVARLTELGVEMGRPTISRIESGRGRAENVTVNELLALAAALDVAPVHLMVPLEDEARLAITSDWQPTALDARAWIRGTGTTVDSENLRVYYSEVPDREFELIVNQSRQAGGSGAPVTSGGPARAAAKEDPKPPVQAEEGSERPAPQYYFDMYAGTIDADG
jgi:transcriptional regulator with XRE-family HTH domain